MNSVHRISLIPCLLLLLAFNPLIAQEENAAWMLKDLLNDSSAVDEIVSFETLRYTHPLYYPNDLTHPRKHHFVNDILIKNKLGLFAIVDNTGRLYKIHSMGEEIKFERIDSTFYSGYNSGAFNFSFRDTIFSMGGYGFWRWNGHLRLPGANPEDESPAAEPVDRRSHLRHERRVIVEERAGHAGGQLHSFSSRRHGTQPRPHESGSREVIDPRVEVVGTEYDVEADVFSQDGLVDKHLRLV